MLYWPNVVNNGEWLEVHFDNLLDLRAIRHNIHMTHT